MRRRLVTLGAGCSFPAEDLDAAGEPSDYRATAGPQTFGTGRMPHPAWRKPWSVPCFRFRRVTIRARLARRRRCRPRRPRPVGRPRQPTRAPFCGRPHTLRCPVSWVPWRHPGAGTPLASGLPRQVRQSPGSSFALRRGRGPVSHSASAVAADARGGAERIVPRTSADKKNSWWPGIFPRARLLTGVRRQQTEQPHERSAPRRASSTHSDSGRQQTSTCAVPYNGAHRRKHW